MNPIVQAIWEAILRPRRPRFPWLPDLPVEPPLFPPGIRPLPVPMPVQLPLGVANEIMLAARRPIGIFRHAITPLAPVDQLPAALARVRGQVAQFTQPF